MSWQYESEAVNDWKYLSVPVNNWKYLSEPVNAWKYESTQITLVRIVSAETQNIFNVTVTLDFIMNYTFEVADEVPTVGNFTFNKNGSPVSITGFAVTQTYENYKLQVILNGFVLAGDVLDFTYTGSTWKTKDGRLIDSVSNYPVTNNE